MAGVTSRAWTRYLAREFRKGFKEANAELRTIGREAEHPLVQSNGHAFNLSKMWPSLARQTSMSAEYEGGNIIALNGPHFQYTAEVGIGTIEVVTRPCKDLLEVAEIYDTAMAQLISVASEHGAQVLGYGIQPFTPPSFDIMTDKLRYQSLRSSVSEPWAWFTATASDQTQVSITREEVALQANVSNLLAPIVIGLCANSPVYSGVPSGVCSAREAHMGTIHSGTHRHGML
ncbi:hypothetical protein CYMTET_43592, partial [Cymbomonas tetramitiformis]